MTSGFSLLGLSSVTNILLHILLTIFPIFFLLLLSLSPPHPKTIVTSFLKWVFRLVIAFFIASGVCAKSIKTFV